MYAYNILMTWDKEAAVWFATSKDIPGLILESGSFEALVERVKYAVPELMELNHRKAPYYNLNRRFVKSNFQIRR